MAPDAPTDESPPVTIQGDSISIKTGTIITLISVVMGAGGGTGMMTMLQKPSREGVQRFTTMESQLSSANERLDRQEELQKKSARLTNIIYKTIIRAHSDAAIPLEDLQLHEYP
jgi:hypothetical protein